MAPSRRTARQAFTLIELLVVIAIIAILTAILLPVFASVREGARQGTSISNMKDIQQKMEQFKLDNHRYPDVLFGYSDGNGDMKGALGRAQAYDTAHPATNTTPASHLAATYFPGLYPAYIKDPEEFTDPNNTVNTSDTGKYTSALPVSLIYPCNDANDEQLSGLSTSACTPPTGGTTGSYDPGATVPSRRNFYLADAYDTSPQVVDTNQISNPIVSLVRYQIAREATACTLNSSGMSTGKPAGCSASVLATDPLYTHQLRWQTPPAETVITATTYHVQNADKVLVLFESGAVKKMTGHDFAAKEGAGSFWTIMP